MTADRRRLFLALVAAVAFGAVAGLVKGDSAGIRSGIGNLSAPWLLIGLLPATRSRTFRGGAITGALCTLAALVAFYGVLTLVMSGQLGGDGYLRELAVELNANRIYLYAGLVSGPLCGAAGAWLGPRRRPWTWLTAGALLLGEIACVALVNGAVLTPRPVYFAWGVSGWAPYVAEATLGAIIALAAAWSLRPRASHAP